MNINIENKGKYIYWVHFILFFCLQLNIFNQEITKIAMLGLYFLVMIGFIITKKYKETSKNEKLIIGSLCVFIVLKFVIFKSINTHLIYWLLIWIYFKNINLSQKDIMELVNNTAIIYFILNMLLHYTDLKVFSVYDVRQLPNKFLPQYLFRYIGLEGSPAGPDIFYMLVLILNLINIKDRKDYKSMLFIIASFIVIIWTSGLSAILALFMAIPILILYKNKPVYRKIYYAFSLVYTFVVAYVYNFVGEKISYILNELSTGRAHLWHNSMETVIAQNSILEWIFGRRELVIFNQLWGPPINNPHNASILALQFTGIIVFFIINVWIFIKLSNIKVSKYAFVAILIIFYISTNTFSLTIRGNPIIIYIFMFMLFSEKYEYLYVKEG